MQQIITSLLDSDFYKFSMGMAAFHQYNHLNVKWKFKCRNNIKFTEAMVQRIRRELKCWANLRFTKDEIGYLRSLGLFKETYLEFLKTYQPNINHLKIELKKGLLKSELILEVEGPWYQTIYWEVPVLAIVSEVYSDSCPDINSSFVNKSGLEELDSFVETLRAHKPNASSFEHRLNFADFGTRRRLSKTWQETILDKLSKEDTTCIGTSNVMFAKQFGIKPIGTMAHEWFQIGQAVAPVHKFQSHMLQSWVDEYRGNLGIALTDIVGIDAFLKEFDLYFAKLYDGVRHDSGCPFKWTDKMVDHYLKLGIKPSHKQLVYSDGLDTKIICDLHDYNCSRNAETALTPNISFGVGTNLTNNIPYLRKLGFKPPQIVMKIIEVDGQPVAKLSDSPGKGMCEDDMYMKYLSKVFKRN